MQGGNSRRALCFNVLAEVIITHLRAEKCEQARNNVLAEVIITHLRAEKCEQARNNVLAEVIISYIKNQVNKEGLIQGTFFRFLRFADGNGVFIQMHDRDQQTGKSG